MAPPRKKASGVHGVQPTIHQFFTPRLSLESSNISEESLAADDNENPAYVGRLAPILPANIHSSLLQVGMRVRKSVRDGYKTAPAPQPAPLVVTKDVSAYFQQSKSKRNVKEMNDLEQEKDEVDMADVDSIAGRKIAVPVSKKRNGFYLAIPRKEGSSLSETKEDFEEADFLKPIEEVI